MIEAKLNRKRHVDELEQPGDWCFVRRHDKRGVVIACPIDGCGQVISLQHTIVCEEPLTVEPSVVGVEHRHTGMTIMCGTHHHFFIKEGMVINATK